MKFRIVTDSACDIKPETVTDAGIGYGFSPLTITFDERSVVDSLDLDTQIIVDGMASAKKIMSACPSPEAFAEEFRKEGDIFCVTITSAISGTYNSAMTAKAIVEGEIEGKKIHVVDSLSASAGCIQDVLKLIEYIGEGLSFEQIREKIEEFRNRVRINFLLGSIDTLVKTGRLNRIAGAVAGAFGIKPILADDRKGNIELLAKARGQANGIDKLIEIIVNSKPDLNEYIAITHANNRKTAEYIRTRLGEKLGAYKFYVNRMCGLATFYAADQGVIVSFIDKK